MPKIRSFKSTVLVKKRGKITVRNNSKMIAKNGEGENKSKAFAKIVFVTRINDNALTLYRHM
jgi:hypothetical protein